MKLYLFISACLLTTSLAIAQEMSKGIKRFTIGPDDITPTTLYNSKTGYGFDDTTGLRMVESKRRGPTTYITANRPFSFSVDLPEGFYNVTVILGDVNGTSATTVRAECRRSFIQNFITKKGRLAKKTFTVQVRDTLIYNKEGKVTGSIKIKPREREYLHWDNRLTIEFTDSVPKVCQIEINKANVEHAIFLAGNSTVVDQSKEPWAAWGQIIPAFLDPEDVVVANYAESGEALYSFKSAGRLDKILSLAQPGDYVFIEFGHNDQKRKGEGVGPFTSYKKDLEYYVQEVRKRGADPVLVTSMHRRSFDSSGHIINTLGDYPAAVRQVAKEQNVALIDLNAMSKDLYEAWGPELSLKAFVHYPAGTFPGQTEALKDNTHFSPYGAYEIARCIAKGIMDAKLPIRRALLPKYRTFDPKKPDDYGTFYWPMSGSVEVMKPDGN
ncbi:rhamnogalacturonan acetylesterase [uncultured Chitinophaga sp.]|uniref:rhamnogalacturonan acetylesterase n=1 Tax=uncultured Chitinophaga sp. TaxID=339340 RepID=UPI0025E894CE|nr:rhamnogalacturonan acetylesterase [uncultured Chitinophaga sp.]